MKINYLKPAWGSVRQQPVISAVSMIGSALAIFLIMVVVMIEEVKTASFAPESNRDRWLVQKFGSITNDSWPADNSSNGPLAYQTIKQVFYRMELPEAVTAYGSSPYVALFGLPGQAPFGAEVLDVDAGFWKVMDFTFTDGKPFSQEDFEAGLPVAILSESTAHRLFGTTEVTGRKFQLNYVPYTVAGVVRDVSNLATTAYAEAWVPYTSTNTIDWVWCDYMGSLSATILPRDKADIPAIREEYERLFAELGDEAKAKGWKFILRERPYTQEVTMHTTWANTGPDISGVHRKQFITYLILLLVPAVNLSSMTQSRLFRRISEIGVKRAFGSTRMGIVGSIIAENFIVTLAGGLLGLIFCFIFGYFFSNMIFTSTDILRDMDVPLQLLLDWKLYGTALLFCFILNLLSSGIPAWRASRVDPVRALSGRA